MQPGYLDLVKENEFPDGDLSSSAPAEPDASSSATMTPCVAPTEPTTSTTNLGEGGPSAAPLVRAPQDANDDATDDDSLLDVEDEIKAIFGAMSAEVDGNGDEVFTAPPTEQQLLRESLAKFESWNREDPGARTYRTTRKVGPRWEEV